MSGAAGASGLPRGHRCGRGRSRPALVFGSALHRQATSALRAARSRGATRRCRRIRRSFRRFGANSANPPCVRRPGSAGRWRSSSARRGARRGRRRRVGGEKRPGDADPRSVWRRRFVDRRSRAGFQRRCRPQGARRSGSSRHRPRQNQGAAPRCRPGVGQPWCPSRNGCATRAGHGTGGQGWGAAASPRCGVPRRSRCRAG